MPEMTIANAWQGVDTVEVWMMGGGGINNDQVWIHARVPSHALQCQRMHRCVGDH